MYVRLAHPARRNADQHLAGFRPGQLNALDVEGAAPLVNDGRGDLYRYGPMIALGHCDSPRGLLLEPL
jgi:hypothetical protein